jgi:putative DNA primase/helicase
MIPNEAKNTLYQYAADGFHLFPLIPGRKIPYKGSNGFKDATCTQAGIDQMLKTHPGCNIGGFFPGMAILDRDPRNGGSESFKRLESEHERIPMTRTHKTGSHPDGRHFLFRLPNGYDFGKIENLAGYNGLDLLTKGCYIVLPPSVTDSPYEVVDASPIAELPTWLCDLALQSASKSKVENPNIEAGAKIPRGQNDSWLISRAGGYRNKGDSEDQIFEKLKVDVLRLDQDPTRPYTEADLRRVAHSAARYELKEAGTKSYHFTDLGNAERLIDRHGANLRYCFSRNMWLFWNGKYWEWVDDGRVIGLAAETIRNLYRLAADIEDKDLRNALIDHARRSESEGKISAMVKLAQALPGIAISIKELDTSEYLLNFCNGTVDLRTGKLSKHSPGEYITSFIPVDYEQKATSELLQRFLGDIFQGHDKLRVFVQRGLGYSCTGSQNEQVVFFPYSLGGSGKSTLLGAVRDSLGNDYACEIEPPVFMVKVHEQGGPNEGIAKLYRKRLAISTEIEDGQRLSVSLIKRMTGGERLHHEMKWEHGFEFQPTHKLWMSGNHRPVITDTTLSIWRRVKLINFPVTIPEDKRDRRLRDKLRSPENQRAILAWLVQGAVEWFQQGLGEPAEVIEATNAYRADQDIVGNFLDECCEFDPVQAVLQADLYKVFSRWCIEAGNSILTKGKLRERIIEKGTVTVARAHGNAASWKGIKFNEYGVNLLDLVNSNSDSSRA